MSWLIYPALAMVFLALADFFLKLSASRISSSLGVLIYAGVALILPGLWVAWTRLSGGEIFYTRQGLIYAAAVGLSFSLLTAFLYLTFASGIDLSVGTPLIRMGGIVLASALGIVIFREGLTVRYLLGFLLAAAGIYLIVTR